jgi:hypothetical protein
MALLEAHESSASETAAHYSENSLHVDENIYLTPTITCISRARLCAYRTKLEQHSSMARYAENATLLHMLKEREIKVQTTAVAVGLGWN